MRLHEGQAKSINVQQFQIVIDSARSHSAYPDRDIAILCVSFYAGLRAMEIAALKLGDVLDQQGSLRSVITLRKAGTKSRKGGLAYLTNPALRASLIQHISTISTADGKYSFDDPLFSTRNGSAFSPSSMSRHFSGIYSRAGFEGCTSHTGRRSLARNLNRAGVSIYNIQKILRHADIAQTVRYIDVDEDVLSGILGTL